MHEHRALAVAHPFTYVYERISQPRSWFAHQRAEQTDPAATATVKLNANGGGEVWRVSRRDADGHAQGLLASSMLMVRQRPPGAADGTPAVELLRGKQFQRVVVKSEAADKKVRLKSGDLLYIDEARPISLVHMMVLTTRKEAPSRTAATAAARASSCNRAGRRRRVGLAVVEGSAAGLAISSPGTGPATPRITLPVMVDTAVQTD